MQMLLTTQGDDMLTIAEQERQAYQAGNIELARALARIDDLMALIDEARAFITVADWNQRADEVMP